MPKKPIQPAGMTAFFVIWIGQIVSILASSMSLIGLFGYFIPAIRNAEDLLPDHDQIVKANAAH